MLIGVPREGKERKEKKSECYRVITAAESRIDTRESRHCRDAAIDRRGTSRRHTANIAGYRLFPEVLGC
jgi:hypothetical protein